MSSHALWISVEFLAQALDPLINRCQHDSHSFAVGFFKIGVGRLEGIFSILTSSWLGLISS
jgi:hypothetical protein